jgi:hypothetical protein
MLSRTDITALAGTDRAADPARGIDGRIIEQHSRAALIESLGGYAWIPYSRMTLAGCPLRDLLAGADLDALPQRPIPTPRTWRCGYCGAGPELDHEGC